MNKTILIAVSQYKTSVGFSYSLLTVLIKLLFVDPGVPYNVTIIPVDLNGEGRISMTTHFTAERSERVFYGN